MPHLLQRNDAAPHDWYFPRAVMHLFDSDGGCVSSVDNALVVVDRDKVTAVIKDTPILFYQSSKLRALLRQKVR